MQSQKITVRKLEYKKGITIWLAVLLMLSAPFLVESKVDTSRRYSLSLVARQRFSSIVLTARLTLSEGCHKKEAVAGALIHFYTCNSAGRNLKEIGHDITKRDGTAAFQWSAPGNGNYWFIAAYVASTTGGKAIMVTS